LEVVELVRSSLAERGDVVGGEANAMADSFVRHEDDEPTIRKTPVVPLTHPTMSAAAVAGTPSTTNNATRPADTMDDFMPPLL